MCQSSCCSMWCCVLWGIGWWLLASVLLLATWNKVVTTVVATVKPIKLWHALLVVAMLIVLFGPMCFGSGYCSRGPCDTNTWQCSPDSCR